MGREFIMPGKIISGSGALEQAENYLGKLGKRALIVTDEVMVKLRNLDRVTEVLDKAEVAYSVYDGIGGEPTDVMIEKGLGVYQKDECDFLIALGGGSPIDSMKAIAALAVNGGKMSDYMGKEIAGAIPPMVAIPTTAGTGSEATKFTIITDTEKDVKMLLKGDALMPNLAIIDPQFTMTAPPAITAATGLDALTHAIEAYTSVKAQPMTDVFAMSAVKRIFKHLPTAFHEGSNVEAREEMSLAALEAGVAFNNASVTLVHGMSRPIGALFHVPHGISNAMLLKECLTFALDGAYERFAELGDAIGVTKEAQSTEEKAKVFLEAVDGICKELEIPTLEKYGIDRAEFFARMDKMADDALISGSPANTRKTVTKTDILAIYENLWS
ncbi:MAG: iron-containing alcohol dehydrogenase [Roseburia sp.]|nr:iron-containing alcohol dehydrogenase [Roseburia sp.]